ncbi:hypothetical protein GGR33_003143 [Methylobacterium brachythecii]|uniref:Uncharacterized protein n=1 Tax=Methylobacterium brachythecii TaxID=1176177 RepID=A0A7W6F7R1_9HYPH|nr:hypothetical protein [Methylobacterium brachythecii]
MTGARFDTVTRSTQVRRRGALTPPYWRFCQGTEIEHYNNCMKRLRYRAKPEQAWPLPR